MVFRYSKCFIFCFGSFVLIASDLEFWSELKIITHVMTIFKNFSKIKTLVVVSSSKKAASIFWYMCNKFLLSHPRSNGNDLEWGFCFGMDSNFASKAEINATGSYKNSQNLSTHYIPRLQSLENRLVRIFNRQKFDFQDFFTSRSKGLGESEKIQLMEKN